MGQSAPALHFGSTMPYGIYAVLTAPWLAVAVGAGNCGQRLPASTKRSPDFLPAKSTGADTAIFYPKLDRLKAGDPCHSLRRLADC